MRTKDIQKGGETMKVKKNITMDEDVCRRIMDFAEQNGISFSGAISVLSGQALETKQGMDVLKQLTELMNQGTTKSIQNSL